MIEKHPSFLYAQKLAAANSFAPKYVKKQARAFIKIAQGKEKKYCIDENRVAQIDDILKLLRMPRGLKAGKSIYDVTCGYQWIFYVSALAIVYRDNPDKRRYEVMVLEICRKNFKTYTVATLFILLLLTEPKFSKFYSVAPDGSLSREVRDAIVETLRSSPLVYLWNDKPRFHLLRDSIKCLANESAYFPLNYSSSRLDGKLPNAFLADEVGALPNSYAIEAMQSGQLNIRNKLGCIISTKYPTFNNPFEDQVSYAKRVLDGIEKDETLFALLFEPDDIKNWATDDKILRQANPVSIEIPEIWEDLLKKRARAISIESARENFLCKHCNIIYSGTVAETYVDVSDLQKCRVQKIDWNGKQVYVGVDLSISTDNCAVSMVSLDEYGNILIASWAFIPDGRIEEKSQLEKCDYREFINAGVCIPCGNRTVDYATIEEFVFGLEERFGVTIMAIGFDRFNAMSSAQKWDEKYNTVEIRQHSDTLHPATKLLKERILEGEVQYERNKLLEINFENARCTYDTTMRMYVNKKRSSGKVDMTVATINAVHLLNLEEIMAGGDFIAQII